MELQSAAMALVLAAIPAGIAWWSALQARRSADRARSAQEESARLERLEGRVSAQKYEVYSPLITVLGNALSPGTVTDNSELMSAMTKFQTWATVYASDAALTAFGRMMQATFHDAPSRVLIRLYADFVLEARKDMGDESSKVTVLEVLAPRIRDLYTDEEMKSLRLPFREVCRQNDWTPPWDSTSVDTA